MIHVVQTGYSGGGFGVLPGGGTQKRKKLQEGGDDKFEHCAYNLKYVF